jgi:lysozyme family protein
VLRRALKLADNSSVVNDAVIAAAAAVDAKAVIVAICEERLRFLQSLKTWGVFGKGWGARVAEVKAYALRLAAGVDVAMPAPSAAVAGKGVVAVRKGAQQGSAGAVAAAPAAQAHQAGVGSGVVVVIAAAAITAAIAIYAFWHWRQARAQEQPA